MTRPIVLLLTFATGATGLVYEVAWQKYLATLLGSQSEATAAVLGLFLAGLSIGYRVFGNVARRLVATARAAGRPAPLLVVYGAIEAAIGAWALLFPLLFAGAERLALLAPLGVAGAGFAFDVGLAALLILPPTVLMGATIPLLTQALAHDLEDATRFHALVYGFNTAGACLGALAAGFVLVPWLGLHGVMLAMASINLVAGGWLAALGRRRRVAAQWPEAAEGASRPEGVAIYAAVALLVGFAMMVVQTSLNRVGALALGSSPFTFAMLAGLFVLCIALGSLVISVLPRIPERLLLVDLAALFAWLLWLDSVIPNAPFWMHVLRTSFSSTNIAFGFYHLTSFGVLLVVVGPAVALSGAALPLLFHDLRRSTGELGATAGSLYAWNTLGSLAGALLGGYVLFHWLDLDSIYRMALAAVLVGGALLVPRILVVPRWASAAGLVLLLLVVAALPSWDTAVLHSGLFRMRSLLPVNPYSPAELLRARGGSLIAAVDDPVLSVSVQEWTDEAGVNRALFVNGKPDSSSRGDRPTTGLMGLLPALVSERLERVFVVGWGTGVTVGELARLESTREIVVAEISAGVLEVDAHFAEANLGAAESAKVTIVRADAYRALLRSRRGFDAIVSAPSNVWVAGVEMLYSREFLEAARERLEPGGVLLQFIHQYEMDRASLDLVFRTYRSVFGEVALWHAKRNDLLLLGFPEPGRKIDLALFERRAARADIAAGLRRSGIGSLPELLAHELWPVGVLARLRLAGPLHTLYHPRLNHAAARAFFMGQTASLPFSGAPEAVETGRENSLALRWLAREVAAGGDRGEAARAALVAEACGARRAPCAVLLADWLAASPESGAARQVLRGLGRSPVGDPPLEAAQVRSLAALMRGEYAGAGTVSPSQALQATQLYQSLHAHGSSRLGPDAVLGVWTRCGDAGAGPEACAQGLRWARAELGIESGAGVRP